MKGYTSQDVARLLGLTVAQVQTFARDGFLTPPPRPARGVRRKLQFSFQDLVILRTAKALVAARIPTRRIRRALKQLRQQLPRGRSLAELRITAEGDRIMVSDGYTAWNPESGQTHLDFAVSDLATRAAPIARGPPPRAAGRPGGGARGLPRGVGEGARAPRRAFQGGGERRKGGKEGRRARAPVALWGAVGRCPPALNRRSVSSAWRRSPDSCI